MSETVADPQHDLTATYAVDPALARRLSARVVAAAPDGAGASHTPTAPFTGAPIAVLPVSTTADVDRAISRARSAQRAWAQVPPRERTAILLRFHDLVLDRQSELLDLIQIECGKARAHAFEEIADVALVARHYARRGTGYLRPRRRGGLFPVLTQSREVRHPKGVVGIVSPWNYPLTLAISDAVPALMAGNAVVLRPDQQTALTALLGVELLVEAGLPEDVIQVVLGPGPTIGDAVVNSTDYVCYTGSTATGRQVAQAAARRLVGVSLELGGKNTMYVAADANLHRAAEGAVRACFNGAGQLCVAMERLVVHEQVADRFLELFLRRVRDLRLGRELDWSADMGSLLSSAQLDTVVRHVEDARAHGATVLVGGHHRPDIGPLFYEPTVLDGVTAQMICRDEETFGPVVSLYRVRSDEEAVALANDTAYGLNASVWSRSVSRARRIAGQIKAGTVNVNEGYAAAWGSVGAPMGGMKDSGLSRRHGAEGITKYTDVQNVTAQHLLGLGAPPGLSQEAWAKAMTVSLKTLKRIGLR
jgi:succinate-semialdehyde dehydrogenase/glutarate-semialdehyde dehydrogenase